METPPAKTRYRRVLLKLSGEALMGRQSFGIDGEVVRVLSEEIAAIHQMFMTPPTKSSAISAQQQPRQ